MLFINRYSKNKNYHYHNSKKISGYVYVVGSIETQDWEGLITKLDANGNIVWEKSYDFEYSNFAFIDIIECDNGDLLLVGHSYNDENLNLFLFRIDYSGNVIWSKKIVLSGDFDGEYSNNRFSIIKFGIESYVFLIKGNEINATGNQIGLNYLIKIDSNGNIITQKSIDINEHNYFFTGIKFFNNKIIIYGYVYYINTIDGPRYGAVIELDLNFNLVKRYLVKELDHTFDYNVINVIYNSQYKIFIGNDFFIKYLIQSDGLEVLSDVKRISVENLYGAVAVNYNEDFIYIEHTNKPIREISKLNHNLEVIFTKTISTFTGGLDLITQVLQNEVLLLQNNNSYVNVDNVNNVNNFLGVINLDLKCCFDQTIPNAKMFKIDADIYIDTNLITKETSILLLGIPFSSSIVQSSKEIVCSPGTLNPCVNDQNICNLYNSILSISTSCLQNPDLIAKGFDSSTYVECVQEIYNLILNFNKIYPQYVLINILENQISILGIYINEPNDNTYLNDWNSVQYILDYLSKLGNCNCDNNLTVTENASIQSGSLYLQAAGSLGNDSTKGIHLRWALKGSLASHLPKANYAIPDINFNKNDDYVKIYRTKYIENKVLLDLSNIPNQINETPSSKNWVYIVGNKVFYVHFKNTAKYNYVKNQLGLNPIIAPLEFIENYGNSLIEIETKTELSFAITPKFLATASHNTIKVELLSVEENKITAAKGASLRKEYSQQEINGTKLVSENIRSIRFLAQNAYVTSLEFEFYSDLIVKSSQNNSWNYLERFALTTEAPVAFNRLEPEEGVLSNWLRYKDGDITNVENYKTRWNGSSVTSENRIEAVVNKYIQLSNNISNPTAIEIISANNDAEVNNALLDGNPEYSPNTTSTENAFEISNLHLLQMGSLDFHVARMFGLGYLDLDTVVYDGQYIYLSEYVTFADLNDGLGTREVQHLSCSLPTGLEDQRLPIPVELNRIENGIFYQPELDPENPQPLNNSALLTDENGLSLDGKTQFYTFFSNNLPEEELDANFYYKDDTFISSELTIPIYAGLKFRRDIEAPDWRRPGLSYDAVYKNADLIIYETKPIIIPEAGNPIYIHRERKSGTYDYTSFGINWFSRASNLGTTITKTTNIKPKNALLPPTNIVATLIQKEGSVLLTTAAEQIMFNSNPNEDKTLVRLTFEYNHAQELIDYHHKISGEEIKDYVELDNELFADDICIKFRNQIPNTISGKIKRVLDGNSPVLSIIETDIFPIYSSGIDTSVNPQTVPPTYKEKIIPIVPSGMEQIFIGSILLANNVEYIIHEIDTSSIYPKFTVFKSDISGALVTLNTSNATNLIEPAKDSLFVIVENMQRALSWGTPNPANAFKVAIDLTNVHKEDEIIVKSTDSSTNTYVQKFRGIYKTAQIEKIIEKVYNSSDEDDDFTNDLFVEKHLGLYKITFSGFSFAQHTQYTTNGGNSVEWYNGMARLHSWDGSGFDSGYRKNFKVIRTENIGTTGDLILYIEDLTFPKDVFNLDYTSVLSNYKGKLMADNIVSNTQTVNYYPGYKVYIYKDPTLGLVKDNVLPIGDEDVRYTMFGLQSHDNPNEFEFDNIVDFFSVYSVPAFMFAQAVKEPLQPQKPSGGMYATRPDYFGKSSYTFETIYGSTGTNPIPPHKPHSVQFNRASDVQFLSAIYDNSVLYDAVTKLPILNTVQSVMESIFNNGNEDFYTDRWNNLLSFNYNYDNDIPNDPLFLDDNGRFKYFDGIRLPMPDSINFIEGINYFIDSHNDYYNNLPTPISHLNITTVDDNTVITFGVSGDEVIFDTTIIPEVLNSNGSIRNGMVVYKDFLKDILLNCFVPLTEVPVIYDYIKTNYKPIPKKQVVRDRNGQLLNTTDPAFDMAPMAVRYQKTDNKHSTKFTDFGLDGASNAKYFYAVREINKQMKTSPYSTILGPVSLVNTAPPTAPEILKIIPILENRTLGINPSIQLQINSYPNAQNIRKINIYRADNAMDALSVRTMKLVKVVDLENENLINENKWIFTDDFSDLLEVPYGDILYFKLTVSRVIKYNDVEGQIIVDYTPSEASKLVLTNIVENYSPNSPILQYTANTYNEETDLLLTNIIFSFNKTVYKGNYHLYKMNSQGNWIEILRLVADRVINGVYHFYNQDVGGNWVNTLHPDSLTVFNDSIYLPLELTNLGTSMLEVKDADSNSIYHHFKMIAENTAGMFSNKENILTLYQANSYRSDGGISQEANPEGMIVEGTFTIRNN